MSDLRQGVTPGAHDVLDSLDALRTSHAYSRSNAAELIGLSNDMLALKAGNREAVRLANVTAAALLILAVERLDEEARS